jgi:hypothetical protein
LVDDQINLRFIFDGEPTEEDVDRCGVAGSEVAADFSVEMLNDEIIVRTAPGPIDDLSLGEWAFRRYENIVRNFGTP